MKLAKRALQSDMFPKGELACGGSLRNKRNGRYARSLSTKETMHMVLRSTLATKAWSFRRHDRQIKEIIKKFANKYGVRIISVANAGNHLHMQIQLTTRHTYRKFIRALTSAIAMTITKVSRLATLEDRMKTAGIDRKDLKNQGRKLREFWDYRPFTRIVRGFRAFLTLNDYIHINRLEGWGYTRDQARFLIEWDRGAKNTS